MSWLSDEDIIRKVSKNGDKKCKEAFYGVYPLDRLPQCTPRLPLFLVVNTHTANLRGEHWKTIFIDKNRRGEVFDSLSQPMNAMLIRWMNRFTRKWKKNHKLYQKANSATCGAFALRFILKRLDFPSLDSFTSHSFSPSLSANEHFIRKFYKSLK